MQLDLLLPILLPAWKQIHGVSGLQNILPLEVVMSMLGTVQSKLAAGASSRASISAAKEQSPVSPAGAEGFEDHCWA